MKLIIIIDRVSMGTIIVEPEEFSRETEKINVLTLTNDGKSGEATIFKSLMSQPIKKVAISDLIVKKLAEKNGNGSNDIFALLLKAFDEDVFSQIAEKDTVGDYIEISLPLSKSRVAVVNLTRQGYDTFSLDP